MSPFLAIGTLVLECRTGCRSPFICVFLIAISAPVLLGAFAWLLLFMRDLVDYCINGCGSFLVASSKRICSKCLDMVSVVLA